MKAAHRRHPLPLRAESHTPSPHPGPQGAKIGPNSLIQTFAAIAEFESQRWQGGSGALLRPRRSWTTLIVRVHFIRLVKGRSARILPPASMDRILERAGERKPPTTSSGTVIPAPAPLHPPRLPRAVALPLVLAAFQAPNAWTFRQGSRFATAPMPAAWERRAPHRSWDGCITCVGAVGGARGVPLPGSLPGAPLRACGPGTRVNRKTMRRPRRPHLPIHDPLAGRPHREVSIHIATPRSSHGSDPIHPNYHSGGGEIADLGPAWAGYIAGAVKSSGVETYLHRRG